MGESSNSKESYAVTQLSGPWRHAEIDEFLANATIPVRLAASSRSTGVPFVVSLWFQWQDGAICCASAASSAVVSALRESPDCGFEIAGETPPYSGVRGQGRAELAAGGETLLADLYRRYGGKPDHEFARWLLTRDAEEMIIRIRPRRMMSWDYRSRMADAFN